MQSTVTVISTLWDAPKGYRPIRLYIETRENVAALFESGRLIEYDGNNCLWRQVVESPVGDIDRMYCTRYATRNKYPYKFKMLKGQRKKWKKISKAIDAAMNG